MARTADPYKIVDATKMIMEGVPQRQIEILTGLSRPFIRKLANNMGYKFARNGHEIVGELCMCLNCQEFFRRPKSKVIRAKNNFCSAVCKKWYSRGAMHHGWKGGGSVNTFSKWILQQAGYTEWRDAVLARDNHTCALTGLKENLEAHHILPKVHEENRHVSLDVSNGITICKVAHTRIHQLMREGKTFDECVAIIREENNFKPNVEKEIEEKD